MREKRGRRNNKKTKTTKSQVHTPKKNLVLFDTIVFFFVFVVVYLKEKNETIQYVKLFIKEQ